MPMRTHIQEPRDPAFPETPDLQITSSQDGPALQIVQEGLGKAIAVTDPAQVTRWAVDRRGSGDFDPSGWITPTLGSGVTNFGNGYGPVRYRRDASGIVRVAGLAAHAFATGYPGKTVFTLPDGYRPTYELFLDVVSNGSRVQLAVNVGNKGAVSVCNGSTWASFDGLSFPAEIWATVVCLGDSITNGFGATTGWPAQLNALLGARAMVIAKGVNGNTLVQAEARRTTDVDPYTPSYAILQAGVNDVMADASSDTIISRMQTTMAALKASGYTPLLCTLLPWGGYTSFTAPREVVRLAVNAWVRSQTTYGYVDLESALGTGASPNKLKAAYDSGDGLHPNNAGTAAIGAAIFAQAFRSRSI